MSAMQKLVASLGHLDQFSSIYQSINSESQNRDLLFVCGGERLSYHQAVVFQHSAFLSNLVKNNFNEIIITLDNVDPVVLGILMDCIYSGKCDKVPGEVLYEVERVHQMLGFNMNFNAETLNADEVEQTTMPTAKKTENFMCFECNMSFDLDIKLKIHMKKHFVKEETLDDTKDDTNIPSNANTQGSVERQNIENPNLGKSDVSLSCSYCNDAPAFGSRSIFLQHLSAKHFRRQLIEKYKMSNFIPYQPCVCCQKPQKNAPSYLVHIGASHKKVIKFLPAELRQKINGMEKRKKPEKLSEPQDLIKNESVEMNLNGIKELFTEELQEKSRNDYTLKQELKENSYVGNEMDNFVPVNDNSSFKQESLGDQFLPTGSVNETMSSGMDLPTTIPDRIENNLKQFKSLMENFQPSNVDMVSSDAIPDIPGNSPASDMTCTVCEHSKGYSSRSSLLQHASVAHFRKDLAQKYSGEFVSGQSCGFCEKVQKSSSAYLVHLGALHEKVFELIPIEMQTMITNYRKKSMNENKTSSVKKNKIKKQKNKIKKMKTTEKQELPNDQLPSEGGSELPSEDASQKHGVQCTICLSDKTYPSKSSFMQHLSIKHFRRSITEKYLVNFQSGQPCDQCQKPQKNSQSYMAHIGSFHKKVLEFLSDEMNATIDNMERNKSKRN